MNLVEFKTRGFTEAIARLKEMQRKGSDIKPIFISFLDTFKEYIDKNWRTEGSPFGLRNKTLKSKAYKRMKQKLGGQGWADLQLTGALRRAATGGSGWTQTINNKTLKWGIDTGTIKYANYVQTGTSKMGQRPFFALADGSFPGVLYERFFKIITFYFGNVITRGN